MLYHPDGRLSIQAARSRNNQNLQEKDFPGSQTIVRKVLNEGEPLYIHSFAKNKEFAASKSVRTLGLQSAICIPLWLRGPSDEKNSNLMGLLYLDSSSAVHFLREEHFKFMEALANHVAVAIKNARMFEELATKNQKIALLNQQLQNRVELQHGNLTEMKILLSETQRELRRVYGLGNLIGKSRPMQTVFNILEKVVHTHATVLIEGESGTGKELVAKYLHYNGPRAEMPLVSTNCAAFSETLLESELFGHRKGAFTGADENKMGLFQLADGGTLFLDEVGDMSSEMQKKLLRVLQNGEIRPVGSKETLFVDVRIIAATNRSLKDLIQQNTFREDLFFRLNVIHIQLPPLRKRLEDMPLLMEYFTRKISDELNIPPAAVEDSVLKRFMNYDWPGNVRELENELRRYF
ncbi:MAG TPA: sigma-54-dependent Fis family transcriptional regulator, partial [Acidobacteriota bacterium]